MTEFISFIVVGVSIGAIYGLAGLGVVLIYKGSRVVNFSQGGIAMVAAISYHELVMAGAPIPAAVIGGLAASAACGLLLDTLISRFMNGAPMMSKLIATVAFLLVLQALTALKYGGVTQFVAPILPTQQLEVAGVVIGTDRLLLISIGVMLAVGLKILYWKSVFGLATVAAADNPLAASTLGHSPRALGRLNWILGTLLAGLAGILIVPLVGITPSSLSQIIFPALAAALLAGFTRFDITFGMAIVFGVVQSLSTRYIEATGWPTALPFLVVILVLLLQFKRAARDEPSEPHPPLGSGRSTLATWAPLVILAVLGIAFLGVDWVNAITVTLVFVLLGLSLVVVTGYTGQLSFAQFTFAGVGALTAAKLSEAGLPFLACLTLGTLVAAVTGLFFAFPALRQRGAALAIISLGLALSLEAVVFSNPAYNGGLAGIVVSSPTILGLDLDPTFQPANYSAFVLALVVLVTLGVAGLRTGTIGRFLIAASGSSRAAESLGVNVVRVKLLSFTISAAIAGLAGVLLSFMVPNVFLTPYTFEASTGLMVAAVLGGVGFISGAFAASVGATGGILWFALSFTGQQQYLPLGLGLLTLIQIIAVPGGIALINVKTAEAIRSRLGLKSHTQGVLGISADAALPVRTRLHTLALMNLTVTFGGVKALRHVDLSVRSGEIVGLVGPNGAGKTTLIDAVMGSTRKYVGKVALDGRDLSGMRADARARSGLGRSFQGLELLDDLTVGENLVLAQEGCSGGATLMRGIFRRRKAILGPVATHALTAFGLENEVHRYPTELSHGKRRLVAVARALASSPRILLLDEPAAGLDQEERIEFGRLLSEVATSMDIGILLVEHDIGLVMSVCDRVVVLVDGEVLLSGTPSQVRGDERVVRAFLGEPLDDETGEESPVVMAQAQSIEAKTV